MELLIRINTNTSSSPEKKMMCNATLNRLVGVLVFCILLTSIADSLPVKESISEVRVTKRSVAIVGEQTVVSGHDVELTCKAHGPTPPLIHWLFNGEHVEQSPLDHFSENMMAPPNPNEPVEDDNSAHDYYSVSNLIIKDANSQNAGTYTCVADLPGERHSESYRVRVTSSVSDEISQLLKRSEDSGEQEEADDTRIYLYTAKVYEFEGVSTRLICRATQGVHKPPPTITWTLNGQPITNQSSGYQLPANGDLKILKTSAIHHMANIKCTAVGSHGKSDVKAPWVYLFEPTK